MDAELAADVEQTLADRDVLGETIAGARQTKIQGGSVQDEVASLLDNHASLYRLCAYEYRQGGGADSEPIEEAVERIASEGHIDADTREGFLEFWDEVDWIVPAVSVSLNNLGGYERHWSNVRVTPVSNDPEMVRYSMRWGVDEEVDATVPGSRVVLRCLMELDQIAGYLAYLEGNDEVDDEFVAYLAGKYDLEWATDTMADILDTLESVQGAAGVARVPGDPEVSVSWSTSHGSDGVVGTVSVTAPGETPDDDEDDHASRGFQ